VDPQAPRGYMATNRTGLVAFGRRLTPIEHTPRCAVSAVAAWSFLLHLTKIKGASYPGIVSVIPFPYGESYDFASHL